MIKILRVFLLSIFFTALGVGLWYLNKSPLLQLKTVEIVLDPSSRESFLFEKIQTGLQASLFHFTGLPFWRVSLEDVMTEVKKDHRVRMARVQRDFPYLLRVIVVPHEPMIGYLDDKGRIFPVARDATLLPPISLKDVPNFPLLRGKEFETNVALRVKAIQLMESISTEGRFHREMVSEILHTNKDGFELFLSDHLALVKMGDGDFDLKASRVEKVLSYLHNRNIKGRVIDARFAKKVVVRVRNGS
jgi:cell division septal protein FtsQ